MYRIAILYPKTDGTTFDHDYYRDSHMPMLAERLGDNCTSFGVDKVLDGPYEAIGYVHIDDLGRFGEAMNTHGAEIIGDVANYTAIAPQLVVSQIVV
jgi:uncharacterized protein (TIGR02118 family)